jgi:hypothetical protein
MLRARENKTWGFAAKPRQGIEALLIQSGKTLVVAQDHDLLDAFLVALVAFDMLESVLLLVDVAGVAVIGVIR